MAYQMIFPGSIMYFPYGDTTYTKLFVGGLAWKTTSETLQGYFEKFGEILESVVISEKYTRRSRGYGFVTFCDPEAAKKACFNPYPIIDGRRVNCNLASLGRLKPYGHIRPSSPYMMGPQIMRDPYAYQLSFGYCYPLFRFPINGFEFFYPQMYANNRTYPPSIIEYATGQGVPMSTFYMFPYY